MINLDQNKPTFICKRLRLLEFLRNKGFYPIKILPDANNPRYNVWLFDNSPELAEAVEEFSIQQYNRNK